MIKIRMPDTIFQAGGEIDNGSFSGRWHFSFGEYSDPEFERFGLLRVFNDDTLTPGAVWPLHPHKYNEVVTYVASGEFRHEDENGLGGILKKGSVQHTTVGKGMWHSEINNRKDKPMRFIQMWFFPDRHDHDPSVEQKHVDEKEMENRLLPLVSNKHKDSLKIKADAAVYSLRLDSRIIEKIDPERGYYLYVLEGGNVKVNGVELIPLSAAMITKEERIELIAHRKTEVLLVDVGVV